jgi:hypothetical protein
VALLPDQVPEAVQAVALTEDHLKVELDPAASVLGLALRVTAGADELTDTVAVWVALPPLPVHRIVKVESALSGPVDCEPLTPLVPPQASDAVHEVVFWLDQVRMDEPPGCKELGLAWRVTTGACELTVTVADCVAKPPEPLQVNSYSVVFDRLPVDHFPCVPTCPCHPPEAIHCSALLAFQISVDAPWPLTVAGDAAKVTNGAGCVTTTGFDGVVAADAALTGLSDT